MFRTTIVAELQKALC